MSTTEVEYSSRKRGPRASTGPSVVVAASIPRSRMSIGPGTSIMQRTNVTSSRGFVPTRPTGEVAALSKKSVQNVKDTRTKEKGDLSGLNQKLAEQMETYRYLQGLVKQCQMETEKWKKMRMFDETKLKEIITDEVDELREALAKEKEKNNKEVAEKMKWQEKYETLLDDLNNLKKEFEDLRTENEKLKTINCNLESEAALLRKDMEFKDAEIKRRQDREAFLTDDAERLRLDLECTRKDLLDRQDEVNALTDELEFLKECKEEECKELQKIIKHMQSAEPDYSRMWTGQFKETIQKLQEETDLRINQHMADMQRSYDSQLAKIQANMKRDEPDGITRTQTNTLKSQISDRDRKLSDLALDNERLRRQLEELEKRYRDECEECEREKQKLRDELDEEKLEKDEIDREMRDLQNDNIALSQEIATYASLLKAGAEGLAASEGNYQSRGGSMLSQAIMGGGGAGGYSSGGGSGGGMSSSQQSTMSENSGTLRVKRQSSCAMSIVEISQDGKYVKLSNGSSSKDFSLDGWSLTRQHPKGMSKFNFPAGFKARPGSVIKIWAAKYQSDAQGDDMVADMSTCSSWGCGNGVLQLLDKNGERKASSDMTYEMK